LFPICTSITLLFTCSYRDKVDAHSSGQEHTARGLLGRFLSGYVPVNNMVTTTEQKESNTTSTVSLGTKTAPAISRRSSRNNDIEEGKPI
jgi:hypothetical protein